MFMMTQYKTLEECEEKGDNYLTEEIRLPPQNSKTSIKEGQPGYFRRKHANYSLLDKHGIIRKGVTVKKGDVLVGKITIKSTKSGDETLTDVSRITQEDEAGIIDRVYSMITPNGYRLIKIVIRNLKIPEVGDKFSSREAQKGTVGMIYSQEDMPFTMSGIVPDIIMNPHAIPSRMTVNQLLETVLGKACVLDGTYGDATPFSSNSVNIAEQLCDRLEKLGYP